MNVNSYRLNIVFKCKYLLLLGSKKKAKGVPTDTEVMESGGSKCYTQNLSIAYLFSCLNQSVEDSRYAEAERTVNYLTSEQHRL